MITKLGETVLSIARINLNFRDLYRWDPKSYFVYVCTYVLYILAYRVCVPTTVWEYKQRLQNDIKSQQETAPVRTTREISVDAPIGFLTLPFLVQLTFSTL